MSSDAIEVLAISFILPPATCDLGLSNSDKGLLNSSVFLGMDFHRLLSWIFIGYCQITSTEYGTYCKQVQVDVFVVFLRNDDRRVHMGNFS